MQGWRFCPASTSGLRRRPVIATVLSCNRKSINQLNESIKRKNFVLRTIQEDTIHASNTHTHTAVVPASAREGLARSR